MERQDSIAIKKMPTVWVKKTRNFAWACDSFREQVFSVFGWPNHVFCQEFSLFCEFRTRNGQK